MKSCALLKKNLIEMYAVGKDLLAGHYPSFVYKRELTDNQIPSFCSHSLPPGPFEEMASFLKENHYYTLSIDEFYSVLTKATPKPRRSVLLTFDDGVGSIWTTIYPLLKKYGFRATVFLVPGRIQNRTEYLPNLEDVWSGKASADDILKRDQSSQPFATWEEIKIMHDSGVIDFESHTLDHSLIFSSPAIVDFVNPKLLAQYHIFEFPRIRINTHSVIDVNQLGAPLYTSRPRMSSARRYLDDPRLRHACVGYVAEHGGQHFFDDPQWRKKLQKVATTYRKDHLSPPEYETLEEQRQAILYELQESKRLIEQTLEKKVRHLCYPWGIGSMLSLSLSKELGYVTNWWDSIDHKRTLTIGQDPFRINRIGDDFFYLLPGTGRDSLLQVLYRKISRRMQEGSPYLSH